MKIKLNIPTSWNDLNTRQLKKIAYYFNTKLSGVLFDYLIFLALVDVRWWQLYKHIKALKTINNVPFTELKKHYPWLYETRNINTFIPYLKINKHTLYPPSDRITNLTVDEFAHADDLYLGWVNTKDFEYLQFLAGVLYRELDPSGKRVHFDKNEMEARAKKISKLNEKTLLAIALSYQGCRSYVFNQFPVVFPKLKSAGGKPPKSSGFGKIILHLSGGKFGTHNETLQTNIYVFLAEFTELLKQKPYA